MVGYCSFQIVVVYQNTIAYDHGNAYNDIWAPVGWNHFAFVGSKCEE